jgi:hypothetical protein
MQPGAEPAWPRIMDEIAMRDVWAQFPDPPAKRRKRAAAQKLWRYFRPDYLQQSLQDGVLYFAPATRFVDPFEGAVQIHPEDWSPHGSAAGFHTLLGTWRIYTKISCWHRATCETTAMWELYAKTGKGVAIRTTIERLHRSIKPLQLERLGRAAYPLAGDVRYQDLARERVELGSSGNHPIKRFFYKHEAYAWEQEHRIAFDLRGLWVDLEKLPKDGVLVEFDRSELVEALIVGPNLDAAEASRIEGAASAAGLADRIVRSSLRGRPGYL